MSGQMSTAISDLAVAVSAAWAFRQLSVESKVDFQFGKWWFMIQMAAASLGVLRFGRFLEIHQSSVEKYHKNFSWLSLAAGFPCLGAQFCILYGFTTFSQIFLGLAVLTLVICMKIRPRWKEVLPKIGSAPVIASMIFLGVNENNFYLCLAAFLFIVCAAVGDEGEFAIIRLLRVDIFHYVLVGLNVSTVWALLFP